MDKRRPPKDQDVGCYLPTPEEIQREAEKIRDTWNETRLKRAGLLEDNPVEVTREIRLNHFKSGERRD